MSNEDKKILKEILLIIIALLVVTHGYYLIFEKDKDIVRQCYSNMMTIEASCELFYLDYHDTDEIEKVSFEKLLKSKILKEIPVCPSKGKYTIKQIVDKKKRIQTKIYCSKHGEIIYSTTSY